MARKVRMDSKARALVNRENAHAKPWNDSSGMPINPDHIVKCWNLYKQGKMTTRQLKEHFPGRTIKAISSKVWKIQGRPETPLTTNPDQEDLFRNQIDA